MSIDVKGRRVFLSGPMTGMPDFNRRAFYAAEDIVCALGAAEYFNPADIAPLREEDALPHERYMLRTLHELTGGGWDLVVMLDGWEKSEGARMEREVAVACGIPVLTLADLATPSGEGGDR